MASRTQRLALLKAAPRVSPVRAAGRSGEAFARHVGQMSGLLAGCTCALLSRRVSLRSVLDQAHAIGAATVPLVLVTSILSGIVTSQQGGYQFTGAIPVWVLGSVVTSSVILELGPVMTAFVVIGRVGARITAEIGSMKITEQIDALHALGRDPVAVLAAPRLVAGIVVVPLLVAVANFVGIVSGLLAARATLGLSPEAFLYGARAFWKSYDVFYSLAKATSFGFVIPLVAVHFGFATAGGAEGVGRATTSAVVAMIVAILVLDAVFPPLLLGSS